jgi:hypothetical protein
VSKAEVASSRTRIFGLRASALAIDNLCFWPPDKKLPFGPTDLENPLDKTTVLSILSLFYSSSLIPKFPS